MNIGKRLEELRKEAGLTQSYVAAHIEAKQNQISRMESGERNLSIQMLIKFAKLYNVTTDYILCLTNIRSTNEDIRSICECTGLSECTVDSLMRMDEEKIHAVEQIIASISSIKM